MALTETGIPPSVRPNLIPPCFHHSWHNPPFLGDLHEPKAGLLPQPPVRRRLLGDERTLRQQRVHPDGERSRGLVRGAEGLSLAR